MSRQAKAGPGRTGGKRDPLPAVFPPYVLPFRSNRIHEGLFHAGEEDDAQYEYERELLRQYEQALSEIEAALGVSA